MQRPRMRTGMVLALDIEKCMGKMVQVGEIKEAFAYQLATDDCIPTLYGFLQGKTINRKELFPVVELNTDQELSQYAKSVGKGETLRVKLGPTSADKNVLQLAEMQARVERTVQSNERALTVAESELKLGQAQAKKRIEEARRRRR